jgi:ribosomal protein S18 acetylase RimI-like enzyme
MVRRGTQAYADDIVRSGLMTREAAEEKAQRDTAETLPQGLATPGQLIFRVEADGDAVGWLWIALQSSRTEPGVGFIYDIAVDAAFRGRGYGREAMKLAEDEEGATACTRWRSTSLAITQLREASMRSWAIGKRQS